MKEALERGAIVWAHLDPTEGHEQSGHRPVLIVSDSRFNRASGTVIAMPLTSRPQKAGPPFVLDFSRPGQPSFVKPGQVRVLSAGRLGKRLELRTEAEVEACLDALLEICGRRA